MKIFKIILTVSFFLLLLPCGNSMENRETNSIQIEIEETTDQRERAYLIKQLGIEYLKEGNVEKARGTFMTLISIAQKIEDQRLEQFALQELGGIYFMTEKIAVKKPTAVFVTLLFLLGILSAIYWFSFKRKVSQKNIQIQEKSDESYRKLIAELNQKFQESSSELEEKNKELERRAEELEKANGELKNFAYMATHDLKEPLRTIGSYVSLIKRRYKKEFDEDGLQFLDFINDGVHRMHSLLKDVLNYAGLDNSFTEPEHQIINTGELIEELKRDLNSQFEEKNGKLVINDLPMIKADRTHIHQIFQNLISNGLKYNDKENPLVLVDCKQEDGFHVFGIHDNGIGFDMAFKDRIFEVFQRLHGKDTFEGTGIGLAIVKKLINHYGGEIWVESHAGQGSKFCFSFPITKEELVEG